MIALFKNSLLSNLTIKIFSVFMGFYLWSFLGGIYWHTKSVRVPVCLYNIPTNKQIMVKPEYVSVQIQGKRADLKQCSDIAFHLNAATLAEGEHKLAPHEEDLFLPKTVSMVNYKPQTITVKVVTSNCTGNPAERHQS